MSKDMTTINSSQDSMLLEEDRKSFLILLKKSKVHGAGPEDFKEYDYEDIGG